MDTASRPGRLALEPSAGIHALLRRLVRGRAEDGAWVRPAFLGVIGLTAFLYIWGLDRNGYANSYYSAAVIAGTRSWKAFFFGSFDAGSFITVDKPPASLWLMELWGRIFGVSSWSILLPEALLGMATVALVFLIVRRTSGPLAAIIGALVTALTPVAVLMFRFNNPDALLTFLLVASAWALIRSLDSGKTRWLLLSAAIIGLAFDTKYLQAYIVLPALVMTYFLLAPGRWLRRHGRLMGAAAVLVVSSGWWMAIVDAIPASARPFIGGSTDNTVLNLVLGYDGFGRLTGALGSFGRAAAPGGGPGGGFGGQPGLLRLFNGELGGEISWLLPLAAIVVMAGLWVNRRAPRTDLVRAGYVLWGMWLLTHAVVFSFASGIFHPYYTVAMAPAIGALVGGGVVDLRRLHSRTAAGGLVGAAALLLTAWWGSRLLARTPDFAPGLGIAEISLAAASALILLAPRSLRLPAKLPVAALGAGLVAVLLGPAAYTFATTARAQSGPTPSSGPAAAAALGQGFGGPGFGGRAFSGRAFRGPGFGGGPPAASGQPGGMEGNTSSALLTYLEKHQGNAVWLVATASANSGASIELATGRPVLAMGGFSGSDPAMTVSRLRQLVSSGQLRYVLVSGGPGGDGGARFGGFGGIGSASNTGESSGSVTAWVTQNCTPVDYSGTGSATTSGLYDCSTTSSAAGAAGA